MENEQFLNDNISASSSARILLVVSSASIDVLLLESKAVLSRYCGEASDFCVPRGQKKEMEASEFSEAIMFMRLLHIIYAKQTKTANLIRMCSYAPGSPVLLVCECSSFS